MFNIEYSRQAVKFLKSLDKTVEGYGEKLFRVRVGDYRILYEVDHKNNLIGIVKIEKRERAY